MRIYWEGVRVSVVSFLPQELRQAGVRVDVLKESPFLGEPEQEQALYQACLDVNEVSQGPSTSHEY